MNGSIVILGLVLVTLTLVVIVGAVLTVIVSRRKRTEQLQETFGPEYENTVQVLGDEKKAQTDLEERQKHVDALDIHPLSAVQRERYLVDWAAVQFKFVDEPGQAIIDADRLIMEVMQVRAYPVSDFEQRAADISVNYPTLVSNYRAARAIAIKNQGNMVDTEELRQAMFYYRSLFDELLEIETVAA
jgi:hypothetical protein